MKTSCWAITLFFSIYGGICGQASPARVAARLTDAPALKQSDYTVVERGPHEKVWQRTACVTNASGEAVSQVHRYTELSAGLRCEENGRWMDSQETITPATGGGAAARLGQHQAYFPYDIYTGAIVLTTPEGNKLKSRPLGLSYFDGTNNALIAELTNSVGQILASGNEVIYTNAFAGISADLIYRYTKSGFEQDVVLHRQLPTPDSLGLKPQTARIQVLTEFFGSPQPDKVQSQLPAQAGLSLPDETLDFGSMKMVTGRAFMAGPDSKSDVVMVGKEWRLLEGRQLLVEETPWCALKDHLSALPQEMAHGDFNTGARRASRKLSLPPMRLAENPVARPLTMAQLENPSGLVLDYVALNIGNLTNFTFRGDTTYYVNGVINLYGTNIFEGGAVIKYSVSASLNLYSSGAIAVQGSSYRPIIFTAKDDNSVGEIIQGSTGVPSGFYAAPALYLSSTNLNAASNLRILFATTGLFSALGPCIIQDAQFINCNWAVRDSSPSSLVIRNALFATNGTCLSYLYGTQVDVENATFADSGLWSLYSSITSYVGLTNCVLANVDTTPNYSGSTLTGDFNGFYNTTPFGSTQFADQSYPFQSVGGGHYYLADDTFRNTATVAIDQTLLANLWQKTTYPPLVYSGNAISVATNFTPQVQRDFDCLDLGYHYDPLDYILTSASVNLSATLTLSNGVALGLTGPSTASSGLIPQNGGRIYSVGLPLQMNRVVSCENVQEQPQPGGNTFISLNSGSDATRQFQFRLTDFSLRPGAAAAILQGGTGLPVFGKISFSDCWLRCGTLYGNIFGAYVGTETIALTNNLLLRGQVAVSCTGYNDHGPVTFSSYNNFFQGGSFNLTYQPGNASAPSWNVKDNLFDGTTQTLTKDGYAYYLLLPAYNGFTAGTINGLGGSNNKINLLADYQSGPLGNYYYPNSGAGLFTLVNAGSRSAVSAGLACNYTILADQTPTAGTVDIGYHYNRSSPIRPGFNQNTFLGNDDASTGLVDLGFSPNFYRSIFSQVYVNENGNVTFNAPLPVYTPFPVNSQNTFSYAIIAPFWADVDTRPLCSPLVSYGYGTVNGHTAFGVNWLRVGYYEVHMDKVNSFQLVLIDRSDTGANNFDVEFNYSQIQWETGDASGGANGFGGNPARALCGVLGQFGFELNGSGASMALLDSNPTTGLIYGSFNDPGFNGCLPGRYVFQFRGGVPVSTP